MEKEDVPEHAFLLKNSFLKRQDEDVWITDASLARAEHFFPQLCMCALLSIVPSPHIHSLVIVPT